MKRAVKKGLIFVISGPSGSGKTTILETVVKEKPLRKKVMRSISLTTRPKRSKEVDKRDYFFVTDREFTDLRRARKILEWTKYLGYYYGTPRDFVDAQLEKGRHILLCLDIKGANKIKRLYGSRAVRIFVMPPSLDVLFHRIQGRCHRTCGEEIRRRVKLAEKEIEAASEYDFKLVNRDLGKVVKELSGIVLKKITNK